MLPRLKGKLRTTHYRIWYNMKMRCTNPNYHEFYYYGGRGIKVCNRWLDSFENFIEDMGLRPTEKHRLDRINSDGIYEKSNCRWTTIRIQNLNQRKRKNRSGYTGVSFHSQTGKWRARINSVENKITSLGLFDTKEDAAKAYNKAAIKYHGVFAKLNEVVNK